MTNLNQILLERECKYGLFEDTAIRTSRIFNAMVYNAPEFLTKKEMSIYYEALHMIAMKISRLVNGGVKDSDGWLDIAGYAMLVHQHIKKEQESREAGAFKNDAKGVLFNGAAIKAMEKQIETEIAKEQA